VYLFNYHEEEGEIIREFTNPHVPLEKCLTCPVQIGDIIINIGKEKDPGCSIYDDKPQILV
jgi:hypothetical protein